MKLEGLRRTNIILTEDVWEKLFYISKDWQEKTGEPWLPSRSEVIRKLVELEYSRCCGEGQ